MKDLPVIIETLKEIYGSHSAAARAIGITPRYYWGIRHKKAQPGQSLYKLMKIMSIREVLGPTGTAKRWVG